MDSIYFFCDNYIYFLLYAAPFQVVPFYIMQLVQGLLPCGKNLLISFVSNSPSAVFDYSWFMMMSSNLLTFIANLSFATCDDLQKELMSLHIDIILLLIFSRQGTNIMTVFWVFRSCVRTLWPGPNEIPITLAKLKIMTSVFMNNFLDLHCIFTCFANGRRSWMLSVC
jgi:hypothetical protein